MQYAILGITLLGTAFIAYCSYLLLEGFKAQQLSRRYELLHLVLDAFSDKAALTLVCEKAQRVAATSPEAMMGDMESGDIPEGGPGPYSIPVEDLGVGNEEW